MIEIFFQAGFQKFQHDLFGVLMLHFDDQHSPTDVLIPIDLPIQCLFV